MKISEKQLRQIVREELQSVLNEQEDENPWIGFENLPPGWDEESLQGFARSLTGKTKDDTEGFFTKCVDRLKDEEGIDDPEPFCAALKDEYLGREDWR